MHQFLLPVANTGADVVENQGHELTKSEYFEHAMELGRIQAHTDESTQGTKQTKQGILILPSSMSTCFLVKWIHLLYSLS